MRPLFRPDTEHVFPLERWAAHSPRVRWPLVMLALLALWLLGSAVAPAEAAEQAEAAAAPPRPLRIGVHLASAHSRPGFEGFNPGLYVVAPAGAAAGVYRNSYGRASAWAGWLFEAPLGDTPLAAGLVVGVVTGYPAAAVLPLAAPSLAWRAGERCTLRLTALPKPPRHGSAAALHLSVEHAL